MPPDRVERLIGTDRSERVTEFKTTSGIGIISSIRRVTESGRISLKTGDILKGKILSVFTKGENKEVEVDFGNFKIKARWNSNLVPEVGKKILVLVEKTSPEIVLKLIETKIVNLREFFLKNFSIKEEVFSLYRQLLKDTPSDFSANSIRKLIEKSGLFLESKINKHKIEEAKQDLKVKLLSSALQGKTDIALKALNILESYSLANLLSKNFFLIPLFLPSPPFKSAELFIDKESFKSFRYRGFLTLVIVMNLEKHGKLKVSLLFDREEMSFDVNFSSHSEELLRALKKELNTLKELLGNKYKLRVTFSSEIPKEPELLFNEIPSELEIKP